MTAPTLTAPGTPAGPTFPWGRMILLALAVSTTVTVEMIPAGLMPYVVREFGIPTSSAGALLWVWAATIGVATVPLVRVLRPVPLRALLIGTLVVMAAATLAIALASDFGFAIAARVVGAAAHGVFWSIVMVYASAIAPREHLGRAVAVAGAGGTAAVLAGVPIGTALGDAIGWRAPFLALGALMLVAAVLVRRRLPRVEGRRRPGAVAGAQGLDATAVPVALIVGVQLLFALAQFALYTYVSPYLTERGGFALDQVSALLLVLGGGGLGGLLLVTLTADRAPRLVLIAALTAFVGALAVLAFAPPNPGVIVAAVAAWGIATGALPPLFLARTLRVASPRLRSTASALSVVAFNTGTGIGAWLGGVLLDGQGIGVVAATASGGAVLALALAVLSLTTERTTP